MKAAVCYEFGKPLVTEDLAFDGPQTGEIGVKLAACAICHNDINSVEGALVSGAHRVIAMDIVDEKLDELITRTHPLEEINGVVAAVNRGEALRRVIVF